MRNIKLGLAFAALFLSACSPQGKQDFYHWLLEKEQSSASLQINSVETEGMEIRLLHRGTDPEQQDQQTGSDPVDTRPPQVVMIHGFGASKENWLRMAQALPDEVPLLIPDLPGHGESSKSLDKEYDLDDQVRYLRNALAQFGTGPRVVMGNSMGGAIAALYAAMHPEEVVGVVLFGPAGIYDYPAETARDFESGRNPLVPANREEFNQLVDLSMSQPPFIPWPITDVIAEKAVADQQIKLQIFADLNESSHDFDYRQALASIRVPVLVIWGEEDRIINAENAKIYEKLVPEAEIEILEGIGHIPMLEAPEWSAERTLEFLSGLKASRQQS